MSIYGRPNADWLGSFRPRVEKDIRDVELPKSLTEKKSWKRVKKESAPQPKKEP